MSLRTVGLPRLFLGTGDVVAHGYFSDMSGSEDDDDYQPPEAWVKSISIGDQFQVVTLFHVQALVKFISLTHCFWAQFNIDLQ